MFGKLEKIEFTFDLTVVSLHDFRKSLGRGKTQVVISCKRGVKNLGRTDGRSFVEGEVFNVFQYKYPFSFSAKLSRTPRGHGFAEKLVELSIEQHKSKMFAEPVGSVYLNLADFVNARPDKEHKVYIEVGGDFYARLNIILTARLKGQNARSHVTEPPPRHLTSPVPAAPTAAGEGSTAQPATGTLPPQPGTSALPQIGGTTSPGLGDTLGTTGISQFSGTGLGSTMGGGGGEASGVGLGDSVPTHPEEDESSRKKKQQDKDQRKEDEKITRLLNDVLPSIRTRLEKAERRSETIVELEMLSRQLPTILDQEVVSLQSHVSAEVASVREKIAMAMAKADMTERDSEAISKRATELAERLGKILTLIEHTNSRISESLLKIEESAKRVDGLTEDLNGMKTVMESTASVAEIAKLVQLSDLAAKDIGVLKEQTNILSQELGISKTRWEAEKKLIQEEVDSKTKSASAVLDQIHQAFSEQIVESQKESEKITKEVEVLKVELQKVASEKASKMKQLLIEKIQNQSDLKQKEIEKEAAVRETAQEKEAKIKELELKVDDLENRLKEAMDFRERVSQEAGSKSTEVETLMRDNSRMVRELENQTKKLEEYTNLVKSLQKESEILRAKNTELDSRLGDEIMNYEREAEARKAAEKRVEELNVAVGKPEEVIRDLQTRLAAESQTVVRLTAEKDDKANRLLEAQERLFAAEKKVLESATAFEQRLADTQIAAEHKISEMQRSCEQKIAESHMSSQQVVSELTNTVAAANRKVQGQEQIIADLRAQLEFETKQRVMMEQALTSGKTVKFDVPAPSFSGSSRAPVIPAPAPTPTPSATQPSSSSTASSLLHSLMPSAPAYSTPPSVIREEPTRDTRSPAPHSKVWRVSVRERGDTVTRTISEALERAQAGDTILVLPGIYEENVVIKKTVRLVGDTETTQKVIVRCRPMQIVKGRPEISNLTLERGGDGSEGPCLVVVGGEASVSNCEIAAYGGECVLVQGIGATVELSSCKIHSGRYGVSFQDGAKGTVRDCTIHSQKQNGITVIRGSSSTIMGCQISKCGDSGVQFAANSMGTVTRCHLHLNIKQGISVSGGSDPAITDNLIEEEKRAVYVFDSGRGVFERNQVKQCFSGFVLESRAEPVIRGNDLEHEHHAGTGIRAVNGAKGTLEANKISQFYIGVEISDAMPTVTRNEIVDVSVGLLAKRGAAGLISDNDIEGTEEGVSVEAGNCVFNGNRIVPSVRRSAGQSALDIREKNEISGTVYCTQSRKSY